MNTPTTSPDIVLYTKEVDFFKTQGDDSLLRHYKKYVQYLADNDKREQFPNLLVGYNLCIAEMRERGIEITKGTNYTCHHCHHNQGTNDYCRKCGHIKFEQSIL